MLWSNSLTKASGQRLGFYFEEKSKHAPAPIWPCSFQEQRQAEQLRASVRVHPAAGRQCLIRRIHHSRLVLWPRMLSSHQATPDPWLVKGFWTLPSASSSTAGASEGGILGPQLGSRDAAGPAATAPLQGDAAWHWCGCTAAVGEGSGRCYLWGNANKCFKNVCCPRQTFFHVMLQ